MSLTSGPFALPMTDRQAFALEARLKQLSAAHGEDEPRRSLEPRRLSLTRSNPEPQPEGRSDISWITAELPDRQGDIVLASGMDDSHFRLNPIVTLNHDYQRPPVGRSLWRRLVRDQGVSGIRAKTYYPPRPKDWSDGPWLPDLAYELLRAGLLNAKSIGFLPLKVRTPTQEEITATAGMRNVRAIVERWLLLEYACCYLPVQPYAVVEEIVTPKSVAEALQLRTNVENTSALFSEQTRNVLAAQVNIPPQLFAFLASPAFPFFLQQSLQRSYQKHIRAC
jgi:hypothetical protein